MDVVLPPIQRFEWLASAIAGRPVHLQRAEAHGLLAFSDGQSIFAPSRTDLSELELWHIVAAQAVLIGAGSLDATIMRRLIGRRRVAERYLSVEMNRAAQMLEPRLPPSLRPVLQPTANVPASDSGAASLAIALGPRAVPAPPPVFGRIEPWRVLRRAVAAVGITTAAGETLDAPTPRRATAKCGEEEAAGSSLILRWLQNPLAAGSAIADLINQILGIGLHQSDEGSNGGAEGGRELPVGRVERALRGRIRAMLARVNVPLLDLDMVAAAPLLSFPEWDEFRGRYRSDWVSVEEADGRHDEERSSPGRTLAPISFDLRRQLAGLGRDHQVHRRQPEGSDLDTVALIDYAIDLRAERPPPSANVYRAGRRTRRDLAAVVMLDLSGSTGERDRQGHSVFDKQLQLAYELTVTLEALGDVVSLVGFRSWGRDVVRMIRLKGRDERWSVRATERCVSLVPAGYTRTGAAVRYGTRMLQRSMRLPNRLLVMITDGIPYDQDYERRYAEADTQRAVAEARRSGAACVCLSVGAGISADKLAELFGAANTLAADDVKQIVPRIKGLCRAALAVSLKHGSGMPHQPFF